MVGLELFRINVQSFIKNGSVTNCNLPDEDGVVRHHCIAITEPLQGSGNSIQGAEFDYRQGFTFLPGFLSNTGMEFNVTYAPSNTGETRSGREQDPVPGQLDRVGERHPVVPGQALPGARRVQLPLEAGGPG